MNKKAGEAGEGGGSAKITMSFFDRGPALAVSPDGKQAGKGYLGSCYQKAHTT